MLPCQKLKKLEKSFEKDFLTTCPETINWDTQTDTLIHLTLPVYVNVCENIAVKNSNFLSFRPSLFQSKSHQGDDTQDDNRSPTFNTH